VHLLEEFEEKKTLVITYKKIRRNLFNKQEIKNLKSFNHPSILLAILQEPNIVIVINNFRNMKILKPL